VTLLPLAAATAKLMPKSGSEWLELSVHVALRFPERWTTMTPGNWRWDERGITVRSLAEALQHRATVERVARNLTPEQREALWADTSPEAAELRQVMRG
jgi:hypothetical protein